MEINTQNMEALLHLQEQQAQLPRKQQNQTGGFDSLLTNQLNTVTGLPNMELARTPGIQLPIMLDESEQTETLDADSAVLMEAFDQASGTLDLWDSYRRTLGNPASNTALRDAWGLLEGIDQQVRQIRGNSVRNPELDSILDELEILTATEKFKFNRGDYIG